MRQQAVREDLKLQRQVIISQVNSSLFKAHKNHWTKPSITNVATSTNVSSVIISASIKKMILYVLMQNAQVMPLRLPHHSRGLSRWLARIAT